ncbi:hypothetical protein [Streptomyces cucumeris]|uniref:hypothetical protein n=1 Tax=Streptomyces cucumeris TaxID=2962890 RepID=UPI003EC14C3C
MARQFKNFATGLATVSLALGGVVVLGSPAQAATEHCSSRWFIAEVDTPGENIDIEYEFCVQKANGKFRGMGYGRVMDGGGMRKVDSFKIETRLERHNRTVTKRVCDYTRAVNAGDTNADCRSPWARGRGAHTGDGRIYIDVDSDGEGGKWHTLVDSAPLS